MTLLRQGAERYADVNAALADGYIPDPSGMCITADMVGLPVEQGAMGIHYLHPELLQITSTSPRLAGMSTHTDWSRPGVLVYEPQADGSLELVGVEQLVFAAGWSASGNTGAPSFAGTEYVHMVDDPSTPVDEAHGFEEHYELHAWVPRDNPNGVFAEFNPTVTCQHATPPAPAAGS
jgi:hypothetical protein